MIFIIVFFKDGKEGIISNGVGFILFGSLGSYLEFCKMESNLQPLMSPTKVNPIALNTSQIKA